MWLEGYNKQKLPDTLWEAEGMVNEILKHIVNRKVKVTAGGGYDTHLSKVIFVEKYYPIKVDKMFYQCTLGDGVKYNLFTSVIKIDGYK